MYRTIIEPFAGAAGYSLRYANLDVILVEKYEVVSEIWRYLISVPAAEVRSIPCVDHVDDLPSWVPQGGRFLVGFTMNAASTSPRRQLSSGGKRLRSIGRKYEGWSEAQRERVASQVEKIRQGKVIDGDYSEAPDIAATWFIDPPYERAGSHYFHSELDYERRSAWCRSRRGQVMVCVNDGAAWLPFAPFHTAKGTMKRAGSREAL